MQWKKWASSFIDLIYPDLCAACDQDHPLNGIPFCVNCLDELPFAKYSEYENNDVEKFFWGRLHVHKANTLFYFQKGEIVQSMIHRLKYHKEKHLGYSLGKYFAEQLMETTFFNDIDVILPVPLHPSKKRKRGYNQSAVIAEVFSRTTNIPFEEKVLIKSQTTASQTIKSREERLSDLMKSFHVIQPELIHEKSVLLVDDILTTGATLEACGKIIAPHARQINIAVLAAGKY